jgi:hypothetical protein
MEPGCQWKQCQDSGFKFHLQYGILECLVLTIPGNGFLVYSFLESDGIVFAIPLHLHNIA